MKNITALLLLLFAATIITAWNVRSTNISKDYTYQNDKQFSNVQQFIGQRILPYAYAEGQKRKCDTLSIGEVEVFVTPKTVLISGLNTPKKFDIIGQKSLSKDFGYEFLLSFEQGKGASKLKALTDSLGYLQQLRLESPHHFDYTFFLPQKTAQQLDIESAYFTKKNRYKIGNYKELIGKTVYPKRKLLHANTAYAIEEQISIKEQLHIQFDKRNLLLKSHTDSQSFRIKNTRVARCTIQSSPNVTKLLRVNLVRSQQQIGLYLNKDGEIEFIEIDGISYLLKV